VSRNRYTESINIGPEDLDYNKWPTVHFDNRNDNFEMRKLAVELYLERHVTVDEIKVRTGISRKELNGFVKKCLSSHPDGRLWGFRALIPYRRTRKNYTRVADTDGFKKQKLTGAFGRLLQQRPILEEKLKEHILNRRKRSIADRIIRIKDLRDKFLTWCRAEEIKLSEYPFNTKDKCLRALARYSDAVTDKYPEEAGFRYGEEAERKLKRFNGEESLRDQVVAPFEVTHLDGHKLDALYAITFTNKFGDLVTDVMSRIWLIINMDEGTRAVLGWHLCLNPEYSSTDVLHCIKNSIVPWKPMELIIPGLKYPDKPGFHSAAIPETEWAIWSEIKLDNAMAHSANIVRDRLTKLVNCSVNMGAVKFPEARHIIERFFGLLEQNYIQRFSNTTGSNPKDPKRKNPEKVSKKYEFRTEELMELIDIAIAEYNNTIHSAFGLSPLEVMEQRIRYRDMVPRVLDESKRGEINFFSMMVTRMIRGSKESGKRPHINFEGEEYTSSLLANNFSLVGAEVIVEVNIDDISVIKVYLPDGQELDYLRVKGAWGRKPHSLKTRKFINKLVREDKLKIDYRESHVENLERYLEEKAPRNKTARNSLAALRNYNQEALQKDGITILEEAELDLKTEMPIMLDNPSDTNNGDLEYLRSILKTNL
jgi:putative transposase